VLGGFIQPRGGISRHDAVNWAYARAANALGVDIIQNCAVQGFERSGGKVVAVQTSQGRIAAGSYCLNVAGHSTQLAELAGFRLPLMSMALQAMVSEPVKPMLDVTLFAPALKIYISQTDRGEVLIGGSADIYNSFGQRGSFAVTREVLAAIVELLPSFSRLKLMRQWGGVVDISPDTSPIMGASPLPNLYLNCGWGTGGYKAIPAGGATMAYTIANGTPHPLITAFGLDRFARAALVDEGAAAGVAH